MTISPSGEGGIVWGEPDFENDGSNLDGLTFYRDLYEYVTFESNGSYIYASTANTLYPHGEIILPKLEGAFAKCLSFEIYAPSPQTFVQVFPHMGLGGVELSIGAGWVTSFPYNYPTNHVCFSNQTGYLAIQPIPTPFTFDTWHTIRHVSMGNGMMAMWLDDELLMSVALAWDQDYQFIGQVKVPHTSNKLTHSLRFRNIRAWSAKTGGPNI